MVPTTLWNPSTMPLATPEEVQDAVGPLLDIAVPRFRGEARLRWGRVRLSGRTHGGSNPPR